MGQLTPRSNDRTPTLPSSSNMPDLSQPSTYSNCVVLNITLGKITPPNYRRL